MSCMRFGQYTSPVVLSICGMPKKNVVCGSLGARTHTKPDDDEKSP
jgi:hypothetical protein